MNGLFSISVSSFHSAPSLLEISELCIFGLSWAIFRRWPLDQTMKAFMGRLMCSWGCSGFPPFIIGGDTDDEDVEDVEVDPEEDEKK